MNNFKVEGHKFKNKDLNKVEVNGTGFCFEPKYSTYGNMGVDDGKTIEVKTQFITILMNDYLIPLEGVLYIPEFIMDNIFLNIGKTYPKGK